MELYQHNHNTLWLTLALLLRRENSYVDYYIDNNGHTNYEEDNVFVYGTIFIQVPHGIDLF